MLQSTNNLVKNVLRDGYYVSGFCDGESSFMITVRKSSKMKLNWSVELKFAIGLHKKDLDELQIIQNSLGGIGKIYKHSDTTVQLIIGSFNDLDILINHFDKYPLVTQKLADYLLFKQAFNLIKDKKHFTEEGLQELVNIKASLNLGLSDDLLLAFPYTKPVPRPLIVNQ